MAQLSQILMFFILISDSLATFLQTKVATSFEMDGYRATASNPTSTSLPYSHWNLNLNLKLNLRLKRNLNQKLNLNLKLHSWS